MLIVLGVALAADCVEDLEGAEARLRARKPLAATLMGHELLRDGVCPDQEGRARLLMGRGLLDLDLPHSAQGYFLDVVLDPPSERSFEVALIRLVQIADTLGDDTELMRLVNRIPEDRWPEPVRDRLHYVAGVRAWQQGDVTLARQHFGQVDPASAVGSQAHYSEAVALLQQGRIKSAAMELLVVGRRGEHDDWAALGMGRVYYGIDRFDLASEWYEQVPVDSEVFAEARFENAWTQFMLNDPNRTLGELLTLKAPQFADTLYQPEAALLEAITWYSLCDWTASRGALDRMDRQLRPVHDELSTYVRGFADEEGRRRAGQAYRDWFLEERSSALGKEVFVRLLQDRALLGSLDHLEAMSAERELILDQKAVWRESLGVELLRELDRDQERVERRAGLNLLRCMAELDALLRDLLVQADIVRYELLRAEREGLEDLAAGGVEPLIRADVAYAVEPELIHWPFNGEFWTDELGGYAYAEQGQCR